MTRSNLPAAGIAALTSVVLVATTSFANVDLTWAPSGQVAVTGTIVQFDLVASSDSAESPTIAAIDAILIWDPAYLELVGWDDGHAGYDWFVDGFPLNPDGLNQGVEDPFVDVPDSDGDAIYTALASPSDPAVVPPPPGLVVTTFQFQALMPVAETTLSFLPEYGQYSFTRVLADSPPGTEITGDIASVARVRIVDCFADLDFDGDVDLSDLAILLANYPTASGAEYEDGDLDADGDLDLSDLAALLAVYDTTCD